MPSLQKMPKIVGVSVGIHLCTRVAALNWLGCTRHTRIKAVARDEKQRKHLVHSAAAFKTPRVVCRNHPRLSRPRQQISPGIMLHSETCVICPQGCATVELTPNGTCPLHWTRPDSSSLCSHSFSCLSNSDSNSRIVGCFFILVSLVYLLILFHDRKKKAAVANSRGDLQQTGKPPYAHLPAKSSRHSKTHRNSKLCESFNFVPARNPPPNRCQVTHRLRSPALGGRSSIHTLQRVHASCDDVTWLGPYSFDHQKN